MTRKSLKPTCDLHRHRLIGFNKGRDHHLMVMLLEVKRVFLEESYKVYLQCKNGELVPNLNMSASVLRCRTKSGIHSCADHDPGLSAPRMRHPSPFELPVIE